MHHSSFIINHKQLKNILINKEKIMLQEYSWLIPIIFMVVGGGILLLLSLLNKGKKTGVEEEPKEKELTERFCMSRYLGGLPGADKPAPLSYCAVTDGTFMLVRGSRGAEIGRIPRDSINNVIVGDKAQAAQQLSAQEGVCLGKISSSQKDTSHCVVLRWENSDGKKHATVFEFAERALADTAAQELKKWMKLKYC